MLKTSEWPTLCYHSHNRYVDVEYGEPPPGTTTSRGMVFIYLTTVNLGIRYLLPRCSVSDSGMGKYCCPLALSET